MVGDESIERVLARIEAGEGDLNELIPPLYGELRAMAERFMQNERRDHTLQPTALVNEVFLRCAGPTPPTARTRSEFLALAARVMRNTLVDYARAHGAQKRHVPGSRVSLSGLAEAVEPVEILDLHEALEQLSRLDSRQAEILELSVFGGMSGQEIADRLGVHRNTIVNELRVGRAWLRRTLAESG